MAGLKFFGVFCIVYLCTGCNSMSKGSRIILQDNAYTLTLGDMAFRVSPEEGGKIISFIRGGKEILASSEVHPVYYGATFWFSPQSDYWPPFPNVDTWPYEAEINGTVLRLTGATDSIQGLRITKEFSVSLKDTAVFITYTVENRSNSIRKLAPWDVARVHGGLSFFPVGEVDEMNQSDVVGTYEANGILWFPFTDRNNEKGQKLFSTAKGGWLAHYDQGLLFVKCFANISPSEVPPGQGEVEIYVAPKGRYLELENHGKYMELQSGESLVYKEKWFLLDVAAKTEAELLAIIEELDKRIND